MANAVLKVLDPTQPAKRGSRGTAAKKVPSRSADVFDDRGRSVAWMMRTVHRQYDVEAEKILARENISISHWYYLRVLAERGEVNQLELSKRVGIASTTAVPALDNMEKRGLLRRTRDPKDRRKYFVGLTDEGGRLVKQLLPELTEMIASTLGGIPHEELQTFWGVLHRIEANLNVMGNGDAVMD